MPIRLARIKVGQAWQVPFRHVEASRGMARPVKAGKVSQVQVRFGASRFGRHGEVCSGGSGRAMASSGEASLGQQASHGLFRLRKA